MKHHTPNVWPVAIGMLPPEIPAKSNAPTANLTMKELVSAAMIPNPTIRQALMPIKNRVSPAATVG